jgi:hypothetical protein
LGASTVCAGAENALMRLGLQQRTLLIASRIVIFRGSLGSKICGKYHFFLHRNVFSTNFALPLFHATILLDPPMVLSDEGWMGSQSLSTGRTAMMLRARADVLQQQCAVFHDILESSRFSSGKRFSQLWLCRRTDFSASSTSNARQQ